ncbi:hypothetical protein KL86DYS1_20117 [uncultured Dysgonomonas sp.]|uniref:Uncharacterized protein n=1 Tax=uncultured Dysgonomonas sp. TaxID=206096 RepID=A0A212JL60_9BACT|nr:hypothetical protein KL86DYS1_20117 [uncultured Dysgonomonas sp.]
MSLLFFRHMAFSDESLSYTYTPILLNPNIFVRSDINYIFALTLKEFMSLTRKNILVL